MAQASRADQQASNVLSDDEDKIVKLAADGLRLLEAEGSAVAFAEVFQQVHGDMKTVATRLRKTDTGVVTVTIENQIIETLEEMIEALKKAIADNKNKPKPGQPGQSGPPPDPKLIESSVQQLDLSFDKTELAKQALQKETMMITDLAF